MDSYALAAQKRSIRAIKNELEFLLDSSLLTSQQLSAITALLPEPKASGVNSRQANNSNNITATLPTPVSLASNFKQAKNAFSEKQQPQPVAPYQQPPPAYDAGPTPIATGTALFAHSAAEEGDLALQVHDKVQVLENMNADWARGRNERTGEEGVFPRSYISLNEEKAGPPRLPYRAPQPQANRSSYGNMPVDVASGSSAAAQNGEQPNKMNEQGKKVGKKIGNAALFGAGSTIGSNIVNSIF